MVLSLDGRAGRDACWTCRCSVRHASFYQHGMVSLGLRYNIVVLRLVCQAEFRETTDICIHDSFKLSGHVGRTMPNAYSRALKAHEDNQEGIRLQKVLAQAGFGSRRKCEQIILDGRVEVDGELVTQLGTRVDPTSQQIRVDGSRVRLNPNHVTLALNKPRKVLSTMDDPQGPVHVA